MENKGERVSKNRQTDRMTEIKRECEINKIEEKESKKEIKIRKERKRGHLKTERSRKEAREKIKK